MLSSFLGPSKTEMMSQKSEALSVSTEGFTPHDLKRLAAKLTSATDDEMTTRIIANAKALSMAENPVKPLATQRSFKDIGGLEEVKKELVQTVVWPGKVDNSLFL